MRLSSFMIVVYLLALHAPSSHTYTTPFFPFSSFYTFDRRLSHSPRSAMKRSARTQISPWSAMRLPVSAVAQRTAPHP